MVAHVTKNTEANYFVESIRLEKRPFPHNVQSCIGDDTEVHNGQIKRRKMLFDISISWIWYDVSFCRKLFLLEKFRPYFHSLGN